MKTNYVFITEIIILIQSAICLNFRNFEEDVIIKFNQSPNNININYIEHIRDKILNRMSYLKFSRNCIYILTLLS
jgi:hypothetical protein